MIPETEKRVRGGTGQPCHIKNPGKPKLSGVFEIF
ncbi:hypothetical protein CLS_35380 [[Clostridium] cf. saccharolyticum K10]|nr:hypothetical protein CLS_35380 [[Clostridium] cf. saccharolyticum K10]